MRTMLRTAFAGPILVHVPKLRFSSKYSDGRRSPQKLKFPGAPLGEKRCKGRGFKNGRSANLAERAKKLIF